MKIVVGLADSGIAPELEHRLLEAQRFEVRDGKVVQMHALPDTLGHGTALSKIINQYCPEAYFVLAQVIDSRGVCSLPQLRASIPWLESRSQIINLSLGLSRQDSQLELICQKARESGRVLIASSPAIGNPVYPASFDTVYAVTGDINCHPGHFNKPIIQRKVNAQANLSGCCFRSKEDQEKGKGGSSFATAHFSGWVAKAMSQGINEKQWRALLPKQKSAHPLNLLNALELLGSDK
mgnify:CR=1 FL=1